MSEASQDPSGRDLSGLRRAPEDSAATSTAASIPEPKQRFWSRRGLPIALLVAFVLVLAIAGRDALFPRLDVRVAPVVPGDVETSGGDVVAQAAGWVEPDPFPHYASALTDGVVEDVLVLEGEAVTAGQVVARLVPDEARLALERAEGELAHREARVSSAEAVRTEAQSNWDNPVELERAVAVAAAEVDGAQAAQTELERQIEAQDGRIAEILDLVDAEAGEVKAGASSAFALTQTRLRLTTARAVHGSLVARRGIRSAEFDVAHATHHAAARDLELRIDDTRALAGAKAALRQAVGERDRAKAARDEAALRLDRMQVRSPSAGLVMRRLAAPGAKVMLAMDSPHSSHIVHLYDPAKLQVRVDVPLADATNVGLDQPAEIIVEVLPSRTFQGRVARIVHEADVQKNTLQVKVAITDPVPDLKPEMLARVRFLATAEESDGESTRTLFAPRALLLDVSGDRAAAWIVDEGGGTAERRQLVLGRNQKDGWIEVRGGLRSGDRVIDPRGLTLSEGRRIRVVGNSEEAAWR